MIRALLMFVAISSNAALAKPMDLEAARALSYSIFAQLQNQCSDAALGMTDLNSKLVALSTVDAQEKLSPLERSAFYRDNALMRVAKRVCINRIFVESFGANEKVKNLSLSILMSLRGFFDESVVNEAIIRPGFSRWINAAEDGSEMSVSQFAQNDNDRVTKDLEKTERELARMKAKQAEESL